MITLYSTNCPKCKRLESKLNELGKEYILIEDMDEVLKFGEEHNIRSAPILVVDDKIMEFSEAYHYLID